MALNQIDHDNLQAGIDALKEKNPRITRNWDYYSDVQPPVWLNDKLAEMFRGLKDRFSLNLCKLGIKAPLNRLWVESWGSESYEQAWKELRLDREQKRIYKHALIAGESYVIGWKNEEGKIAAGFNDPRTVHLFFKVDEPGVKDFAVKVWQDDRETVRANIYYEHDIVRLVANHTRHGASDFDLHSGTPGDAATSLIASAFDYDPADPGGRHAVGEVPVWRFAPDVWSPESPLDELIPIQDVINKLRANKMVASESAAFPQRVYLTTQELDEGELIAEPRTALVMDPGDKESPTSIEQFDAAPLKNYDESISAEINHFFTVAHLPRHLLVATGANASGDSIRSDEGPFAEMVRDIATNFGYTWTDMMHALTGRSEWDKPEWQDARVNSSESQAREFKELVEAQMPPAFAAVKAFGWSLDDAKESGLSTTVDGITNLSDRSPRSPRTQTTEDEPQ